MEGTASAAAGSGAGVARPELAHGQQPAAGRDALLASLQAENARLQAENGELRAELSGLREQVQQLRRRLGLDSSNSGRPPSSDGPSKPPAQPRTRSQRGRSGKAAGGQRGHPGTTLRQTERADHTDCHLPASCAQCGAALSADDCTGEPQRRQVFDLAPPPPLEVTEHQVQACRCRVCGTVTRANGYKLHIDAIDGGILVSCLLTSASLHDSQAAIPLAKLTAGRVDNLYDLMDSAYDAAEIRACSEQLGHVALIDPNPRRDAAKKAELKREALAQRSIGQRTPLALRYHERATVERVNGRLKDEFGGRHVRVRGHAKVLCHLIFGIDALTVDQLLRLTL